MTLLSITDLRILECRFTCFF